VGRVEGIVVSSEPMRDREAPRPMGPSPVELFDELRALPADAAAAKIRELLDQRTLDGTTDERGVPVRVLLTEMMLELGWPHAFTLDPADVVSLREHAYGLSSEMWWSRACVFAAALFTGVWCLALTGMFLVRHEFLDAASFFTGIAFAATALVGAGTWRADVAARLYRLVGNRWALMAVVLVVGRAGYIVGATPSVALALLCMWAVRALRRKSERSAAPLLHTPAR
jgi:hypothetical protein